jgi:hypothetical protein
MRAGGNNLADLSGDGFYFANFSIERHSCGMKTTRLRTSGRPLGSLGHYRRWTRMCGYLVAANLVLAGLVMSADPAQADYAAGLKGTLQLKQVTRNRNMDWPFSMSVDW